MKNIVIKVYVFSSAVFINVLKVIQVHFNPRENWSDLLRKECDISQSFPVAAYTTTTAATSIDESWIIYPSPF